MASTAASSESLQIGITKTEEFLNDIPHYFTRTNDGKLHHDPRKAVVFSHRQDFFADAYGEVLKVGNHDELLLMKERLLTCPIFFRVHMERHIRSYQTRYITHGDFVVMVNTKHPNVNQQIQSIMDEADELSQSGDRFAVEINFGRILKQWFRRQLQSVSGTYVIKYSNFCLTNFYQRSKLFTNPVACVLCFPLCLIAAPLHCAYRSMISNDTSINIDATVAYVQGTTPAQRAAIRNVLRAAYIQGIVDSRARATAAAPTEDQNPPVYSDIANMSSPLPPSYDSLEPKDTKAEDVDMIVA